MSLVVRQGDAGSHGGTVTSGSGRWKCEGLPIARLGDTYACPIHGPNAINAGSGRWKCEGQPIARHGDTTACGATLISGAQRWSCD
ncbi:PAAR domain-containing protein [Methylobacterium sp. D53M]